MLINDLHMPINLTPKENVELMKKALHIFSSVVVFFIIIIMLLIVGVRVIGINTYNYSDGSIIYVKPITDHSKIKAGDTITYILNTDNSIATNTIYSINTEKRFFYVKASDLSYVYNSQSIPDSAIIVDGIPVVPISFDLLIGKVIASLPYMGYVSDFLAQKTGFTIVIAVMAFFIIMLIVTVPGKRKKEYATEDTAAEAEQPESIEQAEASVEQDTVVDMLPEQKKFSRTAKFSGIVASKSKHSAEKTTSGTAAGEASQEETAQVEASAEQDTAVDTLPEQKKFSRTAPLSGTVVPKSKRSAEKTASDTTAESSAYKKYSRTFDSNSKK